MIERTYQQHVQEFTQLLQDVREAMQEERYDDIDPLSIDTSIRKRVWITFGGPNIFIDFILNAEGSEVINARYSFRWGHEHWDYELSSEEADELAEAYGLIQY